ncbi:MAG: glycosyltransferase family 4 protein [Hyphomicrobiales bacterium]
MKVLIVSQHYWPEEFLINAVAADLQANGTEVSVLTGQPNYPGGSVFEGYTAFSWGQSTGHDAIRLFRVPVIPRKHGKSFNLILNYVSFVLFGVVFAPFLLRNEKFDVIFVYGNSPIYQALVGIWLRLIKQVPLIIWVQDLWPDVLVGTGMIKNRFLLNIIGYTVNWIYKRADLILAQSKSFLSEILKRAPSAEVHYHPNPGIKLTDSSGFNDLKLDEVFSIMFAGNLGRAQALETIVGAARLLRDQSDIVFVLIGQGTELEKLRCIAEDEKLNIRLPGAYPRDDMQNILYQSNALLLTLTGNPIVSKTIPSKLQTYFSVGKPVIAAINGDAADLILEAEAGYVGPAEDAYQLSQNILNLKSVGKTEQQRLGENGLNYFDKHFRSDKLTNNLRLHFEGAVLKYNADRSKKGARS